MASVTRSKSRLLWHLAVTLIFSSLVSVANWDSRYEPPVWDTAGGVFAPAIFLYENGFDLPKLLKQPGFPQAGPNVHVLTPITPVTALVMTLFDGERAPVYLTLHLLQFLLTGMLLSIVFFLCYGSFGVIASLGIVSAVFFFPPFLVQSRYMYMEMGGSLFVVATFAFWVVKRYGLACTFAIAACAVKSFGLPVTLALILLLVMEGGDRSGRVKQALITGFTCLVIEGLRWMQGTNMAPTENNDYAAYLTEEFLYRLARTPDLLALLLILLVCGGWYLFRNAKTMSQGFLTAGAKAPDVYERMVIAAVLMVGSYLAFIVMVPISGMGFYPLTRYYIWIWPVVLIGVFSLFGCILRQAGYGERALATRTNASVLILSLLLTAFFSSNRSGRLYPDFGVPITAFSIAERSLEYRAFNSMQASLLAAAELIEGAEVYLNLFDTFYSSSPLMGYLERPKENFRDINKYHESPTELAEYPDHFFLVLSNVGHGGQYMGALIAKALEEPAIYSVRIAYESQVGKFAGSIVEISRTPQY